MPSHHATNALVLFAALAGCSPFPALQEPLNRGTADGSVPTDTSPDAPDPAPDTETLRDTASDAPDAPDPPDVDGPDAPADAPDSGDTARPDPDVNDDACVRQCTDRICGDDGCGGVCGRCGEGFACVDGGCQSRPWTLLTGQVEGFAQGVTGGADGPVCVVTNAADSGQNTLRSCLENGGPVWVRFGASINVRLESRLVIPSDTTIDGRGQRAVINGDTLRLIGARNVIIHNIILDGGDKADGHGVHVSDGANRIWLHHLTFLNQPDTGLRIADTSTDITVSRCWFAGLARGINVGSDGTSTNARVTVHHNLFRNVNRYTPRMRGGRLHAYNNLMENWDIIGAAITDDGQLLSESNLYSEDNLVPAVTVDIDGDNSWGFVRTAGDVVFGETFVQQNRPERVEDPPYAYGLDAPDDDLITDLNRNVGYLQMTFPGQ